MPIPLRGIELGGMVTDDAVSLSPHLHSGLSVSLIFLSGSLAGSECMGTDTRQC